MDLNELQSVRDRERQTDKLQQLRESFYADAGTFIRQLRAERERAVERADDPFDSAEVRQSSDEIKTAEQTVEAIYEKRVGKIVKAASFAAADLPTEVEGMTAEEQALFDNLVGTIKENREQVLTLLDGEDSPNPATGPDSSAADATSSGIDPETGPANDASRDSGSGEDPVSGDSPAQPPADDTDADEDAPTGPDGETESDDETAADVMGGEATEGAAPGTDNDSVRSSRQPESTAPDRAIHGDAAHTASSDSVSPSRGGSSRPSSESVDPAVRKDGGQDTGQSSHPASSTGPADSSAPEVERQRVQILENVETFLGFDERDYDLEPDDVVSLPATNADILLDRGVAREL